MKAIYGACALLVMLIIIMALIHFFVDAIVAEERYLHRGELNQQQINEVMGRQHER